MRRILSARHAARFDAAQYWESRHRALCGSLRAVGHLQLPEEANARQYEIKRDRIVNLIRRYVPDPRGRRLLDAGCGAGLLTAAYVELGFAVVGVDFAPTAIRQARAKGIHAEFVLAELAALDLPQRFDVIAVIDVFLHLVSDKALHASVAALARHLQPQGVLIMLDRFGGPADPPAEHVRLRSQDWYAQAFQPLGLEIVEHDSFRLEPEGVTKDMLAVRVPVGYGQGLSGR